MWGMDETVCSAEGSDHFLRAIFSFSIACFRSISSFLIFSARSLSSLAIASVVSFPPKFLSGLTGIVFNLTHKYIPLSPHITLYAVK